MKLVSLALLIVLSLSSPANSADLSIRSSRLPSSIKRELAAVVMAEIGDSDQTSPADQRRIAVDSKVTFLVLRRGAPPAVLIEPSDEGDTLLCAENGNGNCPFWLFQQSARHAVLLLEDSGINISMAETSHNGMRDIVIAGRLGHTPVDVVTTEFHFDGKTYQAVVCSELISEDEGDTKIPPHPCNTPGRRIAAH